MKNKRLLQYTRSNKKPADPMDKKEEVARSTDNKIDQDFPGFPHGNAAEKIINPKTKDDRKIADVDNKDGEKTTKYSKNQD